MNKGRYRGRGREWCRYRGRYVVWAVTGQETGRLLDLYNKFQSLANHNLKLISQSQDGGIIMGGGGWGSELLPWQCTSINFGGGASEEALNFPES